MCNQYRTDLANMALWGAMEDWRQRPDWERWSEHGRNMPSPFQSFPNTAGRIVTLAGDELRISEPLWGMPTPPKFLVTKTGKPMAYDPGVTNVRNADSPHWRRWTGVENRCLVPFTAFAENAPRTYLPTWFAFADGRRLGFFAGIRDDHSRQVRAKDPERTQGEFYAFLTTEPNAEVEPVHPKAMPVILTSREACETWLTAPWPEAVKLQRPLPDGALRIVGTGKDWRPSDSPEGQ